MSDRHVIDARDISTAGFRGSDLRDLLLGSDERTDVSLKRFLRQWLVMRVTDNPCPDATAPEFRQGALHITVLLGETATPVDCQPGGSVLYDRHQRLATMYPGLVWPATFLLNPEGRLVAIVEGDDQAGLIQHVLNGVSGSASGGGIDLGDIFG